ncbi:MAG: hypothetical protein V4438_01880 [Patescibacteria group bacterium]
MFTLHHLPNDGIWAPAMGPHISLKSNRGLIVVPETCATKWVMKMLHDLPQEQLMVLTGIQKIVNTLLKFPEFRSILENPSEWPTCDGTERLQHLLLVFPQERKLMLDAIQEIVDAALDHHAKPSQ